jgi:hypothetical protein
MSRRPLAWRWTHEAHAWPLHRPDAPQRDSDAVGRSVAGRQSGAGRRRQARRIRAAAARAGQAESRGRDPRGGAPNWRPKSVYVPLRLFFLPFGQKGGRPAHEGARNEPIALRSDTMHAPDRTAALEIQRLAMCSARTRRPKPREVRGDGTRWDGREWHLEAKGARLPVHGCICAASSTGWASAILLATFRAARLRTKATD